MKKLLHTIFAILGCLHLLGGPYSIVQIYAWSNMLVSYSKGSSISEAVTDTFSGEKPCHLCKKITEAKSSTPKKKQNPEPLTAPEKLTQHLFPPSIASLKNPSHTPLPSPNFLPPHISLSSPPLPPPTPPPTWRRGFQPLS